MSYVSRVLEPGETVLYSTRLHWRSHLPAVFFLAIAIGCAVASAEVENSLPLFAAAAVFLVLAIASWIPAAIRRSSSEFVVTDRRVILKRGMFGRHTIEMNRTKVESVDLRALGPINRFLQEANDGPKPYTRTTDPDKIFVAVRRPAAEHISATGVP